MKSTMTNFDSLGKLLIALLLLYLSLWMGACNQQCGQTGCLPGFNNNDALNTIPPPGPNQATITFTPSNDYLANPGIGWQEAINLENPRLPETVSYRRSEYSWAILNPQEGVLDWSMVDRDLQEAVAQGKQFSFRIYTMRGESFGGHQMPQWVVAQGAEILDTDEPYYSNCVYQEKWGQFVDQLRQKYDGNPNIAWIDISGYGNFNEWSWHGQTEVNEGSLDSQARQRLADMFIGGSATIQCATLQGGSQTVSYSYQGFQQTQLLMPYAGIQQSSRYVASRRADVGFRHDCLGSVEHTNSMLERVGDVINTIWRTAPVVYEFCSNPDVLASLPVLQTTHGSLVHDNTGDFSVEELANLLRFAGYRFALKQATYPQELVPGLSFELSMIWVNTGYAPIYPKMGEEFVPHLLLVNDAGATVQDWSIAADVAQWMPAATISEAPPEYPVTQQLVVDQNLAQGAYHFMLAMIDTRTGKPIQLAISGRDELGRYPIGPLAIAAASFCCKTHLPLIWRSAYQGRAPSVTQLLQWSWQAAEPFVIATTRTATASCPPAAKGCQDTLSLP